MPKGNKKAIGPVPLPGVMVRGVQNNAVNKYLNDIAAVDPSEHPYGSNRNTSVYNGLVDMWSQHGRPDIRPQGAALLEKFPHDSLYGRASFDPSNNTMYVNKVAPQTVQFNDFVSELAHSEQWKNSSMLGRMGERVADWMRSPNKEKSYNIPGTIENTAHEIIEPALRKEFYQRIGYNPTDVSKYNIQDFIKGGEHKYNTEVTPYQYKENGGLFKTDRKAFVDSALNANRHLDFVQRLYDKNGQSIQIPGQPHPSTHYMSYDPGSKRVYPEVVNRNGQLSHLQGDDAWNYADSTKEYMQFPTVEQAEWFSNNGYKQGTGVLQQKEQGGKIETMKKFKGKKYKEEVPKAYFGAAYGLPSSMQRGLKQGLDLQLGFEQPMQSLPQADMRQMPVTPVQNEMRQFNEKPVYTPPPAQRQTGGQQRTFTTPGTGDMIGGMLGIANALLPGRPDDSQYHRPQYGNYNPNSLGTGSQALYDDGGAFSKGLTTRTRQEGGFRVTEQIPNNLGYGNMQPAVPAPLPPTMPPVVPMPAVAKKVSYEKLKAGNRQTFLPKFEGNWSRGEINNYWKNIPTTIGGNEVLRGKAWEDLQNPTPQAPPRQPFIDRTNISFGENTNTVDSPGVHYSGYYPQHAPRYSFEDGGRLSVGQQVDLTPEELLKYKQMGYKFK